MIFESIGAAVRFLPRAWSRPWFLACLALTFLAGVAGVSMVDPRSWVAPTMVMASIILLPLFQGPLYSLALDGAVETGATAGSLRYFRLVAVAVLTVIFLAIPGLLISVIGLGVAYGMAYSHPGFDAMDASSWTASGPVFAGSLTVMALGGLAILWLAARVSLSGPSTVMERRVLMISTWPLTRGLGWRLLVARLLVSLGVFAIILASAAATRMLLPAWSLRVIPVVSGALLLGLRLPLKVGVMSYFYRYRSPLPG